MQAETARRMAPVDAEIQSVVESLYAFESIACQDIVTRGNLFTIFCHDLIIHFSGILIQRAAPLCQTDLAIFPYVNCQYARKPGRIDLTLGDRPGTVRNLKGLFHAMRLLRVARGEAIPFGYKQRPWLSRGINALTEYQVQALVFVQQMKKQKEMLREFVDQVCVQHSICGRDVIMQNWNDYLNVHCTERLIPTKNRLLIIGNRQNLQNRKLAHNFMEQGKEVIAFTHGEIASTIFTEPMYRYAEKGVCTSLVEYGEPEATPENEESAMLAPVNTLYRNSTMAQKTYRRSDQIFAKKEVDQKLLYIPTTYVGSHIYGPHHAYPDNVYAEWHVAIQKMIPSIVFKKHPKSRGPYALPGRLEERWLDDCIEEYDCYVLDYLATSAVRAMLTSKPILYFDIGLRPVTDQFLATLKERCFYWKININANLNEQVETAIMEFSRGIHCGSNLNIAKYCLCKKETFSWRQSLLQ